MTVRELLQRIDSREIAEWMAYAVLEPFGEQRADARAGIISATMANFAGKMLTKGKTLKPADFFPNLDESHQDDFATDSLSERIKLAFGYPGIHHQKKK